MANMTRREALRMGGLAFVGLATIPAMAGCTPDTGIGEGTGKTDKESKEATKPALANGAIIAREAFVGLDAKVLMDDGTERVTINFDNAATTPALVSTLEAIQDQLPMYGSVGRGKGQKQAHSTEVFTDARTKVLEFLNAPAEEYETIWCGTATDGLNRIAGALATSKDDIVLTTRMEHHANDLPWRLHGTVVYAEVDEDGRLKLDDIKRLLAENKVKVVSVQAASNVTGYVNDVHTIAEMAHEAGAIMVVDGAQIAAHRTLSMKGDTDAADIDLFVLSGHKMYAPFGSGAIVGKTKVLNKFLPAYRGGGMVDIVSDFDVTWLAAPSLWEAGSPNYFGAVALVAALDTFNQVTFDAIQKHEQKLLRRAVDGLASLPKVTVYGDTNDLSDRVGVISFSVDGMDSADVASILANKYGIAVRQGEFCAHPYCHRLMGVSDEEIVEGMRQEGFEPPSMVRISFGLYNDESEVDTFLDAMGAIAG